MRTSSIAALVLVTSVFLLSCGSNSGNKNDKKADSVVDIASVYQTISNYNLSSVTLNLNDKGYDKGYFDLAGDVDNDFDKKPLSKWSNYISIATEGSLPMSYVPVVTGIAQVAFSQECADLINQKILSQGYKQTFCGDFDSDTMSGKAYLFKKGNTIINYVAEVKGLCADKNKQIWWYIIKFKEEEDNPCQEGLSVNAITDMMKNEIAFTDTYSNQRIKIVGSVTNLNKYGDNGVKFVIEARDIPWGFTIYTKEAIPVSELSLPTKLTFSGYVTECSSVYYSVELEEIRVYDTENQKYLGDAPDYSLNEIQNAFGL